MVGRHSVLPGASLQGGVCQGAALVFVVGAEAVINRSFSRPSPIKLRQVLLAIRLIALIILKKHADLLWNELLVDPARFLQYLLHSIEFLLVAISLQVSDVIRRLS